MKRSFTMRCPPVFIAAAAVVLAVSPALAPPVPAQESIRLGAKLAMNVGWFGGSDWNDFIDFLDAHPEVGSAANETRIGVTGGGFLEAGFTPNFALQLELLIASVGGAYSYDLPAFGIDVDGTITATGLKLPVLLKPKVPVGRAGALYLLLGPAPVLILGDVEYEESGGGFSVSASESPDNRFVFSATAGAGYEHTLGPGALGFEVRYNRTFTDIFDNDNTRINSVSFCLGYGFDLF